ncbi:MFS peptide transporter-like protein Ptr2 [Aaosphaeria arxii CBS 175.79]|uniref:MFS peptide transporter-like protein Ptr2 n=1 Tax=Aaosphaeria arxii CBS 175.79 TaxID=1450172 RepID=A0A6A5XB67_9PLEO|nr:MFS peptide transporter-like protein Ptr2 [Aaosphaeria arxii CBS 175.79]KAF2010212.1 MFS peptide transporter-like protein Ptr2 [Aaosphaeria arxii CBS 175.79]
MAAAAAQNAPDMAMSHEPKVATPLFEVDEKKALDAQRSTSSISHDQPPVEFEADMIGEEPTEEDLRTLRRVSGKIPWVAYTIAFVELCERFGYYGCQVLYTNFIQHPLPAGQPTGRDPREDGQPGALDMGQRASFGIGTFNSFWAYSTPILGAIIADEYLGRFNTIFISIAAAIVGHIFLIVSALPSVLASGKAIAPFMLGVITLGFGTGAFKANISPLIAEQYKQTKLRVVIDEKTGERVISDPSITLSRIFLYFYMMINIGSLTGQISMVFVEKYIGFWCSFLLPTILFCCCPIVLWFCRHKYHKSPPTGSVLIRAIKLWSLAQKGKWSVNPVQTRKNFKNDRFWEDVKPSHLGANKPAWMKFDDAWVDQVARGLRACSCFTWIPLYWLCYNQMNNNLTSQAATMTRNGVPNDVITNLNPISLVIFIPLVDNFLYPGLRKAGIRFTPIKRITAGFFLASMAMVGASVIQHYIYATGKCGKYMNSCKEGDTKIAAPINVWVQAVPYVLVGFSEIFASITGLEYAFTKAPKNMRSLVTSYWHFMSAFSNAIGQALVSLSEDPLLVWNYAVVAILASIGGVLFWFHQRDSDAKEDAMNMLPDSNYVGRDKHEGVADETDASHRA